MIKRLLRWLSMRLMIWTLPNDEEMVRHLTVHTAALELLKNEYVELAPTKGCCGPIRLSGNSLPVFEYTVFEKAIMEFIRVRVEISRPDRIAFRAWIESTTAPERNGERVDVRQKYKEPFLRLGPHIWRYFPIHSKDIRKVAQA